MKQFLVTSILVTLSIVAISQIFWTEPENRDERRKIRAQEEQLKTKALLEKNARSGIEFLSTKYDIDILQDQLNKIRQRQQKEQKVH